jgi:transcriptional regulator
VHVYGRVQILDLNQTTKSLKKLIDKFEINSDNPVRIEDLSKKTMLQARSIIGFEIEITNIQAVKKLSQNRDNKNYQNIISELEKTNKPNELSVAIEMKKCTR